MAGRFPLGNQRDYQVFIRRYSAGASKGKNHKILLKGIHQPTRQPSVLVDLKYLPKKCFGRCPLVPCKRRHIFISLHLFSHPHSPELGEKNQEVEWGQDKLCRYRLLSSNPMSVTTDTVSSWNSLGLEFLHVYNGYEYIIVHIIHRRISGTVKRQINFRRWDHPF